MLGKARSYWRNKDSQSVQSFKTPEKEILTNQRWGSLIDLSQLGIIENVPTVGSCGFYSCMLGLKYTGQRDIPNWVTDLILLLCKHGTKHVQR